MNDEPYSLLGDECAAADCSSKRPAFDCYIVVRNEKTPDVTRTIPTRASFCAECAPEMKVEAFLGDDLWREIVEGFKKIGRLPPTRRLTTLEMRPRPQVILP